MNRFAVAAVAVLLSLSPAFAAGTSNQGGAPDVPSMSQIQSDLNAEKWSAAIDKLKQVVEADSSNADAYNLLGFAYRKSGNLDLAQRYYTRALRLKPNHRGALEYQGELFVMLGQTDKAKANLAKLETICGTGCEEYKELSAAIGG
jgi:cytochrome c-type biogenesis protein CcmH/NrfG